MDKRAKDLETLAALAIALLVLYFIFKKSILIFISFGILVIAVLFKKLASVIAEGFLKISRVIAGFNSRLILSLFYFFLITPVSIFYRFFSKSPVLLKKSSCINSYYYDRNHAFKKEDFEKAH